MQLTKRLNTAHDLKDSGQCWGNPQHGYTKATAMTLHSIDVQVSTTDTSHQFMEQQVSWLRAIVPPRAGYFSTDEVVPAFISFSVFQLQQSACIANARLVPGDTSPSQATRCPYTRTFAGLKLDFLDNSWPRLICNMEYSSQLGFVEAGS